MEVHLRPETEARLAELAEKTGRQKDDLVEDAMAGYLMELVAVRETLDTRYDDIRSGRIEPLDGEQVFQALHQKSAQRRGH
jgi:predicted transcriptional regulator